MSITARVLADSKNEHGNRITTFIVTFPRIVLSEINTHRAFSRNSASSRAIPFKKMVKMVEENPFIPIKFQKDHSGMQGSEYFDEGDYEVLKDQWLAARDSAIKYAKSLSSYDTHPEYGSGSGGVTKQLCNRLLEPFMYHTALITATEWENFFALRAHPDAEIHIADLAKKMLDAYNESTPVQLKAGEWHMPFGDQIDNKRILSIHKGIMDEGWGPHYAFDGVDYDKVITDLKLKICSSRCARTSYMNFEGKDDYEADIKLHDDLIANGHWSPMEHCARAMTEYEYKSSISGRIKSNEGDPNLYVHQDYVGWCGNFRGFVQYRKTFQNENKKDPRVLIK